MENVKTILMALAACFVLAAPGYAKIPAAPLTPEQQAKADEAKAKAAEAAKKEGDQLGKAQDRAAENYKKGKGKTVASASAQSPKK